MTGENGSAPTTEEFVEYCRTQAGLLRGSVETMVTEADELLAEIDAKTEEIRARLDERSAGPATPQSTEGPDDDVDLEGIEAMESDVERQQLLVRTKQARMEAFRELADDYDALAGDLRSNVDDGREAMERVVEFEADRDAPAYFEDRLTVLEAAAGGSDAE
ncbi:hypothetical protein [Halalkalicoccus jeotgali]|uniref:Uncharacterized protein n=1 Tax=Halalkalicoccus jeotgali (strain DSM 18796 / CECT 7217 / JCM 14584 / KCTC 4019 / B3) TaxID=795797 RepID=D8J5K9_HALJB|nr:hypothetical protein [Halalkalicoccus jeotgali]ADJ15705.1 hypothetical protein HacjB3_11610 [Halalkalicoccus jeotgali B3]ELY36525.1 hypothetical protein C497_11038 [Halalkalicoccus jeotgali B3]